MSCVTLTKEAAKQALEAAESLLEYEQEDYTEALRKWGEGNPHRWERLKKCTEITGKVIAALRSAIDAPEQEPSYWLTEKGDLFSKPELANLYAPGRALTPLYTAPPAPQASTSNNIAPSLQARELSKPELAKMWHTACRRAYLEDEGEAHEFFARAVLAARDGKS